MGRRKFVSRLVLIIWALSACSAVEVIEQDPLLTPDGIGTAMSSASPMSGSGSPTVTIGKAPTNTPLPIASTSTPMQRSTSTLSTLNPDMLEDTDLETPTKTNSSPCYQGTFIDDVTFRDGTDVTPGDIFLKIWRFRNDGSCAWSDEFIINFQEGQRFSGPDGVRIKYFEAGADLDLDLGDRDWTDQLIYEVLPGESVDIPMVLRAPLSEGRQRGYWQVFTQDTENAVLHFYVDVDVADTVGGTRGVWNGEWDHVNNWSDESDNPLVLNQQDRQVDGFYYRSNGDVFLIDASLSRDGKVMEGAFGQVWQTGFPFVLELYPNENVFHGLYNDSAFTVAPWCGSRPGFSVPLGECMLVR